VKIINYNAKQNKQTNIHVYIYIYAVVNILVSPSVTHHASCVRWHVDNV